MSDTKKSKSQLIRYGVVGITSNLLGYLAYLWITGWKVEPKIAMTLLYAVGAGIGFIGNRYWTFGHEGALFGTGVRYCAAHLGGYLLNLSILFIFVDRLGLPHQFVQACAVGIVAGFLYLLFKHYVFQKTGWLGAKNEKVS